MRCQRKRVLLLVGKEEELDQEREIVIRMSLKKIVSNNHSCKYVEEGRQAGRSRLDLIITFLLALSPGFPHTDMSGHSINPI